MAVTFVQSNYLVPGTMRDPDDVSYDGPYELTMTNVGAGNCLVAFISNHGGEVDWISLTVTDDNSDTWTIGEQYSTTSGIGSSSQPAYLVSATGGTTVIDFEIQTTANASAQNVGIYCAEFSGVDSIAYALGRDNVGNSPNPLVWGSASSGTTSAAQDVSAGDMILAHFRNDRDARTWTWQTTGVTDDTPVFTVPFKSDNGTTLESAWKIGYKSFASDQLSQNIETDVSGFSRISTTGIHLVASPDVPLLKYIPNITY
jgi:hypothetical protein